MLQSTNLTETVNAVRRASALTESMFVEAGRALETSIEILATLTSTFEVALLDLEGEDLSRALTALSWTAAHVAELGQDQATENVRLDRLGSLIESVESRITRLKVSLKNADCLTVNSKIAAANIRATGTDFTTFAGEVGRTLRTAETTLDSLAAELNNLTRHVAAARSGQSRFEKHQREAAHSITERLLTTVKSIALQHQHAARASLEVRQGSARIRQRICDAVVALQIGDITRQRLEHADFALGLVIASDSSEYGTAPRAGGGGRPVLDDNERRVFIALTHRLQAAQLSGAAENFEHRVRQITASLNSLAQEARALRSLSDSVYRASDAGGGTVIMALEGQVGEALVLFEGFETVREDVAKVIATVSNATGRLRGHLRTVQSLEDDIRIMGLNTTFRCARIGTEGIALSLIAQELRAYANGFAKEAGALMREIENIAEITGSLTGGTGLERSSIMAEGTQAMRTSLATLRRTGQTLDVAMADLERDSERVRTLLEGSVATLQARNEIGVGLREVAGTLAALAPPVDRSPCDLGPGVEQMLELIARRYSMADERAVHDRVLGRSTGKAAVPETVAGPELEEFLF